MAGTNMVDQSSFTNVRSKTLYDEADELMSRCEERIRMANRIISIGWAIMLAILAVIILL